MIRVENGTIKIAGHPIDLALNFMEILDTLMEESPEIIISAVGHRAEELSKLTEICNTEIIQAYEHIYTKLDKGEHDHE